MAAHRQGFPTPPDGHPWCPPFILCEGRPRGPRGNGKSDPKGGLPRPPDCVARSL